MNDEQLTRLFRSLDEQAEPDAAFSDALFARLERETHGGGYRRRTSARWVLLAAALLVAAAVGAAAAVGSGLVKLPFDLAVASATPEPSGTPLGSGTPAPSPSASTTPTPSSSPAVSTAAPLATASSATFDVLAATKPAGFVSTITCSGPIGASDPVAIVQLHAAAYGGDVVLRDYTDVRNPRTVCTFGAGQAAIRPLQLIDARHVVIDGGPTDPTVYAVVDLPALRYHWFQLPHLPAKSSMFIAVGPKLDQVLWLTTNQAGTQNEVHISTQTGDHLVATLPDEVNGICGGWGSKSGAYTLSGDHLFVLNQPHANALNSLLVISGQTPVFSLVPPAAGWGPGANPMTAVWSPIGETLFYLRGSDVWKWTPGAEPQRFLAGVVWSYPTITPDGAHLAYEVSGDVYLVDLAHGGSPQLIGKGRIAPVFLNSSQLWTTQPIGCTGPPPTRLIYDLNTRTQAPTIIDQVLAVWPATSSNY